MDSAETACQSPTRHLNSLLFSPPPENIHTSTNSDIDQPRVDLFQDLALAEEPPKPAACSYYYDEKEFEPIVCFMDQFHYQSSANDIGHCFRTER